MELTKLLFYFGLMYCVYSLPDENNFKFILYENNYELLKNLNKTFYKNITLPEIVPIKLKHLNYSQSLNLEYNECFMSNDIFLEKLNIKNINELNNTIYNEIQKQTSCIKNYPLYKDLSCSYIKNPHYIDPINITTVKYSTKFTECSDLTCEEDELYSKDFTECIEHTKIKNQLINEKEVYFINKTITKRIEAINYMHMLQAPELFYSCSEFLLDLQDADCFKFGSWNYIDNCKKKNLFDKFYKDLRNCFIETYSQLIKGKLAADSNECLIVENFYVDPKLARYKQISNVLWRYINLGTLLTNPDLIKDPYNEYEYCNEKIKKIRTKIYNGDFLVTDEAKNIYKIVNENKSFFKNHCNEITNFFNKKIKTGQFRKNYYTCDELIIKMYTYGKSLEYQKNINYYKNFPYIY